MNIIQRLTLRHMRMNKRRTLVTVLGIVISVAMITAVSTFAGSFMDLMRRDTLARTGDWQVEYQDISPEQAALLAADQDAEKAGMNRTIGYLQIPTQAESTSLICCGRILTNRALRFCPWNWNRAECRSSLGKSLCWKAF